MEIPSISLKRPSRHHDSKVHLISRVNEFFFPKLVAEGVPDVISNEFRKLEKRSFSQFCVRLCHKGKSKVLCEPSHAVVGQELACPVTHNQTCL